MNIVFGMLRNIVIDYNVNGRDIETTGILLITSSHKGEYNLPAGNICGHENPPAATFKLC